MDRNRQRRISVHPDYNNIQNNVPLLSALLGGEVSSLELPTDDFSVLSRHDLNAGTDPALYLRLSRASNSAYVVTAAVWPRVAVLRLTEVDTVSRCHHDEGAREEGSSPHTNVGVVGRDLCRTDDISGCEARE